MRHLSESLGGVALCAVPADSEGSGDDDADNDDEDEMLSVESPGSVSWYGQLWQIQGLSGSCTRPSNCDGVRLAHFIWYQSAHVSHATARWFFATGLQHAPQGHLVGPGLDSISPEKDKETDQNESAPLW